MHLSFDVQPRSVMIPVTTFAGRKVAVFGLGGSGLVSASALLAGGAEVVGWDDNAEFGGEGGQRRHPDRRPARDRLEHDLSSRARAGRAAHASGAALVGRLCADQRRRSDRRYRAVLSRAPRARAGLAVRGDHRHQRQIDHDRADGAPPRRGGLRCPARRQYRHRHPVARTAGRRPRPRHRVLVLPDRSCALARPVRWHPDQHFGGSSRSTRYAGELRGREGASGGGRA